VALPNVATDLPAMRRNADLLVAMLGRRGFACRLLDSDGGPPVVYGERPTADDRRTVVFYAHYDGQPVEAAEWTGGSPFEVVLRRGRIEDGAAAVSLDGLRGPTGPEWRLYGRSTSDDKGPIVAFLAALDALEASGLSSSLNLKVVLDGEEERGSPHLEGVLRRHRDLLAADLWIFCDGPVHQTRRPQVVFGVRGVDSVQITTYGPAVALHSGHYGNWAPDPGMQLAHLVASMRDRDGNATIAGLESHLRPFGATERAALEASPPVDEELKRQLDLGWTEGQPATLAERITRPAVNLLGFRVGEVGEAAKNAIPPSATAVVGFRLVPDVTPSVLRAAVERHVEAQGYTVVHAPPDGATRRRSGRLALLEWGDGYPALWTPMDLPVSRAVLEIVDQATDARAVATPSLGGSLPLAMFHDILGVPLVVVPIVNHDNHQHGPDENLRLANLWDGIAIYAALVARLGEEWEAREHSERGTHRADDVSRAEPGPGVVPFPAGARCPAPRTRPNGHSRRSEARHPSLRCAS